MPHLTIGQSGLFALIAALAVIASIIAVDTAIAGEALGFAGTDLRINARQMEDGRVQFALQQRVSGENQRGFTLVYDKWRDREIPNRSRFPAGEERTAWLYSSPVAISVNRNMPWNWLGAPEFDARIAARRLDDGRIEFGLQVRNFAQLDWSKVHLPESRFMPASLGHSRWLNSSSLTLSSLLPTVPAALPVSRRAVVRHGDLDGWSYNGLEPTLYYGTEVDPLDDGHQTWVIMRAQTDSVLYKTLRLQVSCNDGYFDVWLWEDNLPYVGVDRNGNRFVPVSFRFDGNAVVHSERWYLREGNGDAIAPLDDWRGFGRSLRDADKLVIRVWFRSHTLTATFEGLQAMWNTPVQPNLEYCGRY